MDELNTAADAAGQPDADASAEKTYSETEFSKVVEKRDRALKERNELRARLAELETIKDQLAEAEERKAQDWGALEKRLNKTIEALREENSQFRSQIQQRIEADRMGAFADAIATATGVPNGKRLRGLLREAQANGFDIAPEEVDKSVVVEMVETLRSYDPETFAAKDASAPSPRHANQPPGGTALAEIQALAQRRRAAAHI